MVLMQFSYYAKVAFGKGVLCYPWKVRVFPWTLIVPPPLLPARCFDGSTPVHAAAFSVASGTSANCRGWSSSPCVRKGRAPADLGSGSWEGRSTVVRVGLLCRRARDRAQGPRGRSGDSTGLAVALPWHWAHTAGVKQVNQLLRSVFLVISQWGERTNVILSDLN